MKTFKYNKITHICFTFVLFVDNRCGARRIIPNINPLYVIPAVGATLVQAAAAVKPMDSDADSDRPSVDDVAM